MLVNLLAIASTALGEYIQVPDTEILFDCWSSLCSSTSIGNNECNALCMSPMCNYDSLDDFSISWNERFLLSDCYFECLNSECDVDSLGNGFCDELCNSVECGFDLGDCAYCDADCKLEDLKNDSQDESCNSPQCRFDNNMFGWCAEGCFKENLESDFCPAACKDFLCLPLLCCPENCSAESIGDGICDQDCIYDSCSYDSGDCDCSPGCSTFFKNNMNMWFSTSECSEECMSPSCLYNYPFACTDEAFIEIHLMHHIQQKDFNAGAFEESSCDSLGCDELMRTEVVVFGSCDYTDCNNAECIDCLGYSSVDCEDPCTSCSGDICYRCKNTMLDFGCIDTDKCPSKYAKFNFGSGLGICIPKVDTSTAEDPYYIYVGKAADGSSGNGSEDSPYSTLENAFAAVWANYTVIKLSDGEFYYSPLDEWDNSDIEDVDSPLFRAESSGILKEITIEGSSNSIVLFHDNHQMVIQARAEKLVIKNIEFSAEYFLEKDCDNDICRYCRYFEDVSGDLFDDRRNLITESFPSHCSNFKEYIPIIVEGYNKLEIHDCSFKEFRFQSKALISSNGEVYLKNVKFYKIQTLESVILLNSDASLLYEGGSVEYLNDGYEVSVQMDLKGFASGSSFKNAHFYDVVFDKNIVLDPGNRDEIALFSFMNYKGTVIFHQCNFTNLYVKKLIYIDLRMLLYEEEDVLNGAYSQYQLNVTGSEFQTIFSKSHLIQVRTTFEALNVLSNKNNFQNIYSETGMIVLQHSGTVRDFETNGEDIVIETESNGSTTVPNPPRTIEFHESQFSKTYFHGYMISIEALPMVKFNDITINNSGDNMGYYINDQILNQFIDDPSYVSLELDLTGSEKVNCESTITLQRTYSFEIDKLELHNINCDVASSAVLGLKIQNPFPGLSNHLRTLEIHSIYTNSPTAYILYIENISEITLTGVQFFEVYGDQLTLIYAERGETLVFEDLSIEKFYSTNYGAMHIESINNVRITDSSLIDTSTDTGNGGFLSYVVPLLSLVNPSLTIENSHFIACVTDSKGGAVYITSEAVNIQLNLNISNSDFQYNAAREGSAIYIGQEISLETGLIYGCTFHENISTIGGVIQDLHFAGELKYIDSEFKYNSGYVCGIYGIYISTSSSPASIENSIFEGNMCEPSVNKFESRTTTAPVYFNSCTFRYNEGVSIDIERGLGEVENCSFEQNAFGIFAQYDASVNGKLLNFTKCFYGIISEDGSSITCDGCRFTEHYFLPVLIRIDSNALITNSEFYDNTGEDNTVIYINSSNSITTIRNCRFLRNSSTNYSSFFFISTYVEVIDCVFDSNKSEQSSPGIYAALTTLTIRNSQFKNQSSIFGSFLVIESGTATIEKCTFSNGVAEEYSAALFGQASIVTIIESHFEDLSSNDRGCITLMPNERLEIRDVTIINSKSDSMIFVNGGEVVLDSLTIESCTGSAIELVTADSLTVYNSKFKNLETLNGAIYAVQNNEVTVRNSNFTDIYSDLYGAGLNLIALSRFETLANYTVESCNFSYCTSDYGGAIYAIDGKLNINGSSFVNNEAYTSGGALYFSCPENEKCLLSISNSSFADNVASHAGGAVRWVEKRPTFESNTYNRNSANYGNNIASYATTISSSARVLSDGPTLTNVAPGQLANQTIVVDLKDEYGNTVFTDSSSTATLVTYDSSIQLSGVIKETAENGTYTFDEFIIGYTPGSVVTLGVVSDAISASDSSEGQTENINEIQFQVELRECVIGEEDTGSACNPCEEDEYSFEPSQLCQSCPSRAVCPGLWEMYPKKKYWRTHAFTVTFYECPNTGACLGGEETLSYTGTCAEGYKGNMCQSCAKGYSRTSKDTCGKCPDHTENAILLVLVLLGIIGFSVFLVRSAFKSAYIAKALHSIYLKIMTNYIQLVFLTTQFNLAWPKYVLELFDVQESTATMTEQIFSIDCYVGDMYDESEYQNVYYARLIFLSMLPLFVIGISSLVWYIIGRNRGDMSVLNKELICTITVLFFFLHPTFTKAFFSVFSCREIEGQGLWLVDNLDIKCWDEEHSQYAFGIALPSLLVWSISTPIFTLFLMYRRRNELYLIKNRIRFGFLFNGFRDNRYYWEFVILYRKILIITLSVFLSNVSIPIQALTVLLLFFVSLYLHYRYEPFGIEHLNEMESSGILVATITIYCGLYYLTEHLDEHSKIMFFILILVFNFYFLCYWMSYMFRHIVELLLVSIPFLRKKHMRKDGFSEDGLQKCQHKQFSFSNREHKYYTFFKQAEAKKSDENNVDIEKFSSVLNLYMENAKFNYLEHDSLTNDDDLSFSREWHGNDN